MAKKDGLTDKQRAFIAEYLRDKNATQAAIRAGYSAKTASQIGEQNLRKIQIRSAIDAALSKSNEAAALESVRLRREISRVAFSDVRNVFHPDGRLKLPHELDAETAAAIASVEIDIDGKIKYKFWDKNSAHERAAKILGEFERDNSQKTDPLTELVKSLGGKVIGPVKVSNDEEDEHHD